MNPLFTALFDDAAIFPPASVPLADAVKAHRDWESSPLVGPFVCDLAHWDELAALVQEPPLKVSLVLPGPVDLPSSALINIVSVEGPHAGPNAFTEIPCHEITPASLKGVQRLKIRTGGVRPEMFPTEASLAVALSTAVRAGVPFKLTAGLHDPIRHRDPVTGFEHHGFLNVILATARAVQGYDCERALADQDGTRVAAAVAGLSGVLVTEVRRHFVSFGTCSISEPIAGLVRHGLIPSEDPR